MKPLLLLATLALCGLSSCEKARELAGRFTKKPPAPAVSPSGSWVSEISESEFDSFRTQPGKVVVIDFHAVWCGPCRNLAPILDQIATEHGGTVLIGKVNVDQNRQLAANEGVRSIPDVRIFRDGREVDRFVGLPAGSEVRQRIEIHTKGLVAPAPAATGEGKPANPQPVIGPASKDWLPPGMQRR
jgi:thioredoxin 1